MINYTDILGEAYEDNHVNFVNYFHSKEKFSVRKDRIEIMYFEWFLAKAQIVERDFFIDGDRFIQRCSNECTIVLSVLAKDESKKNMILDFTFMLSALNLMCKAIDEAPEDEDEAEAPEDEKLTTELNQVRMKAIHQWLQANKYINVDIDSWLYWFSLQTWLNKKKKPSKIKWTNAAYHLPNVVYLICGNMSKFTEKAMQKSFTLQKGSNFQKVTNDNIKRDKEPYKSLYKIIEYAEKNIKDLQ